MEKNGTRRASWDWLSKQLQESGLLQKDPAEAYKQLVADLKQVIPETALETKFRKKAEFETLEQAGMRHTDFHIKFRRLLVELTKIGAQKMDEEDLFFGLCA